MKLVKTASGKQTVKISKKEWEALGKQAGWMKQANWSSSDPNEGDDSMKQTQIFLKISNALRQLLEVPSEKALAVLSNIYKQSYLLEKLNNPSGEYSENPIENFIFTQLNKYNSMPLPELQRRYEVITDAMKMNGIEVMKF